MKLTLQPTAYLETIDGQACRRWEGTTETGVAVHAWVRMVLPHTTDKAELAAFAAALKALPRIEGKRRG